MPIANLAPLPNLLYGTAWKKEHTAELVIKAYYSGFRGFDTACQPRHYSEPGVGEGLRSLRDLGVDRRGYYLQSKYSPIVAHDPESVPYDPKASIYEQVLQSFAVSLENLATDYLDGLILHSPLPTFEETVEAWTAMEKIHSQEGAMRLGISNCYDLALLQHLYNEANIKPVLVQNRFYQNSGYDLELRHWCRERDITYQSFWTLTANPHLLEHPQLLWLARRYGKTPAQVLFCYLHQRGVVPLTGTTSKQHMQEDLAGFERPFANNELEQLDRLLEQFAIPLDD